MRKIIVTKATIAKLDLKPSDILVVTVRDIRGQEQFMDEFKKHMKGRGVINEILFVSNMALSVLSKEETEA